MRLLLVEDDKSLGEGILTALIAEGYTLDWLQDGASALHALSSEPFDLAILDPGLPAWTVCRCSSVARPAPGANRARRQRARRPAGEYPFAD